MQCAALERRRCARGVGGQILLELAGWMPAEFATVTSLVSHSPTPDRLHEALLALAQGFKIDPETVEELESYTKEHPAIDELWLREQIRMLSEYIEPHNQALIERLILGEAVSLEEASKAAAYFAEHPEAMGYLERTQPVVADVMHRVLERNQGSEVHSGAKWIQLSPASPRSGEMPNPTES